MWNYNFTAMNQTVPVFKVEERPTIPRTVKTFKGLLEYAKTKYGCEFSEDFTKKMNNESFERWRIPENKVVDALVREWRVWEPYVSEDSFSGFIEDGLESIIRIQATATFHSPVLNGYIGNKAKIVKKLPNVLATCVSAKGVLCINGKSVEYKVVERKKGTYFKGLFSDICYFK